TDGGEGVRSGRARPTCRSACEPRVRGGDDMRFHSLGLALACSLPGLLSCSGPGAAESVGEATAAASNNGTTINRTSSGPEAFASFSADTGDPCLFVNTFLDATQDPSGNGDVYAAYENYNFCTGDL